MFSLHYITFLIILFFLFYNAIGKNKTITHRWFVRKQRYFDVKTARWLLKIKRLSFRDINEVSFKKLEYIPILLVVIGFLLLIIFPKNTSVVNLLVIGVIIIPFILIGLTSSKRLLQIIKKNIKTTLSFILMTFAAVILLLLSGEKELLKTIIEELSKPINMIYLEFINSDPNLDFFSPLGLLFTILLSLGLLYFLTWVVLRIVTKLVLWLLVGFGKLCHTLNNNSPLKPFYLLIQIGSVIFSEVILKLINS